MSEARNEIKDARIRQRKAYREMMSLKGNGADTEDRIQQLRAEIDREDETISYFNTLCGAIDSRPIETRIKNDRFSNVNLPPPRF